MNIQVSPAVAATPSLWTCRAFGWDWIIAPKRYKANYCSGQCEYMFMQKYPHTHLVQQLTKRLCRALLHTHKMSPINMLYFNDKQQIIYG